MLAAVVLLAVLPAVILTLDGVASSSASSGILAVVHCAVSGISGSTGSVLPAALVLLVVRFITAAGAISGAQRIPCHRRHSRHIPALSVHFRHLPHCCGISSTSDTPGGTAASASSADIAAGSSASNSLVPEVFYWQQCY